MMRLAAKLVAGSGCLLGGEIALLPFGNLEERVGNSFGLTTHCTNIQGICINVQWHFRWWPNARVRKIRQQMIGYRHHGAGGYVRVESLAALVVVSPSV